jgi:hypothetical protein
MHTLWDIATKRGANNRGNNEQSDIPPSKDVFKSFICGSHGKRLFIYQFRAVVMCCATLVDTSDQAGYWHAVEEFLDSLNTP